MLRSVDVYLAIRIDGYHHWTDVRLWENYTNYTNADTIIYEYNR